MDHSGDGVDIVSSMPHEILHHILSFIPTQFAIRTSALSKAWRHVWCHTPCLDFSNLSIYGERSVRDINQTLSFYRAPKIMSLNLRMPRDMSEPQVNSWIEFAVCRNVEKLSLVFDCRINNQTYIFPDFFYLSSSLTELLIHNRSTVAGCTVFWKSLRKLTLWSCSLSEEYIENILSGSPVLETLKLSNCIGPQRLDLSKSRSLRRLVYRAGRGTFAIVAPHIHSLRFIIRRCETPCTLVDVSLLAEASIHICFYVRPLNADFLQTVVLNILAKLQNAKRLTFTRTTLQILSLAELHGVPFPTFKVETLTVKTTFIRSVIPGLARLLQNSPKIKKLIAHATRLASIPALQESDVNSYLRSQGLNQEQCWGSKYEVFPTAIEFGGMIHCKDAMWKLIASFMEVVMRNGKILETLVVGLKYIVSDARWFEEWLQMIPTLPNNNNVSIVLKR
ncbi:unnamed protein product [Eruca vesicaria subsp. sativa]|uniref:F-box domain-containing protein n=1 Tax=Eruca vesicaria subsp. sativa TaxID=29727 RepID=A0ABC8LA36_ERUVS|nr:unnamed protein product [Eruca vesicaria subsp. sativa]